MRKKLKKSIEKARQRAKDADRQLGLVAQQYGAATGARVCQESYGKAYYWKKKVEDPFWKPGSHGGHRIGFSAEKEEAIVQALKGLLFSRCTVSVPVMVDHILITTGHAVSQTYVKGLLATVDMTYVTFLFPPPQRPLSDRLLAFLSCKVPETKQINKYSESNMLYYVGYLRWLHQQDPHRLKFLDESHFQAKGTLSGTILDSWY